MKFIKRLIILSGEENKGTLMFEKNAYGVFVKLNTYGQPIRDAHLCMLIDQKKFVSIASAAKFNLKGLDTVDAVHAAVFCEDRLVMYGTNQGKRLSYQEIIRLKPFIKKTAVDRDNHRLIARLDSQDENIFSKREPPSQREEELDKQSKMQNIHNLTDQDSQSSAQDKQSKMQNIHNSTDQDSQTSAQDSQASIEKKSQGEQKYIDDAIAESNYYPPINQEEITKEQTVLNIFGQKSNQEEADSVMDVDTKNYILQRVAASIQGDYDMQTSTVDKGFVPPIAQQSPQNQRQVQSQEKTGYEEGHYPCKLAYSFIRNQNNFINALRKKNDSAEERQDDLVQTEAASDNPDSYKSQDEIKEEIKTSKEQVQDEIKDESQDAKEPRQIKKSQRAETVAPIASEKRIKARSGTFYERNGEEIERLFLGEREKDLEKLLPNSKWVRIDYNGTGKYYVIGLIGKEYLCYGVPAVYTPTPPKELYGYCWWFPLKPSEPQAKGYWIMYQNLTTGQAIFPPKQ